MNKLWKPIFGRPIVIALLLLTLGACATFEKGVGAAKLAVLESPEFAEMTLVDVVEAGKLATLTDDKLALRCWDYIETFVRDHAGEARAVTGEVVGPLSTYQQARNVRRSVIEVEISDEFRIACGPMLTDSMAAIGRIGIRIIL